MSTHGTLVGPEVISHRGGEHPPILGRSSLGLDEDWGPQDQCPEHERQGRGLPQACVLTPRPPSGLLRTGMRG